MKAPMSVMLCIKPPSLLLKMAACLKLVSFNLHGFNQASDEIESLIVNLMPTCLLLQEHWLTSDNLSKLDRYSDFYVIGSPALRKSVEQGPVYDRPSGGLATLIHRSHVPCSKVIEIADRLIAVLVIY
jgi:hypothetical protein